MCTYTQLKQLTNEFWQASNELKNFVDKNTIPAGKDQFGLTKNKWGSVDKKKRKALIKKVQTLYNHLQTSSQRLEEQLNKEDPNFSTNFLPAKETFKFDARHTPDNLSASISFSRLSFSDQSSDHFLLHFPIGLRKLIASSRYRPLLGHWFRKRQGYTQLTKLLTTPKAQYKFATRLIEKQFQLWEAKAPILLSPVTDLYLLALAQVYPPAQKLVERYNLTYDHNLHGSMHEFVQIVEEFKKDLGL